MDDVMVIALFRHALTEENKRRGYLGWSDSPLCLDEARSILPLTRSYNLLFSSDSGRCVHTAELLFPNKAKISLYELREMNFGEWEGKTYSDLRGHTEYENWLKDPGNHSPPQGEHFTEFRDRVHAGWGRVLKHMMHDRASRAAVVTHGGVIRLLLSDFAPIKKEFWEWNVPHGYGFELIFKKEMLRRGGRCTSLQEVPLMAKKHG
ncbi:histidine phosphatase family protein [Pseudalkalibacillus sp. A8]|uniref:histidine phosphatase family protein n=1 Tax=Pseudalkalibacillus sp. A8 TaxID=3382641 RepID=UPI0038B46424